MEPDKPDEPRRRGRPPTGTAKSSTERNDARRERLKRSGCRILSTVTLDPFAAVALARLTADGRVTIDEAVSAALVAHAGQAPAAGGPVAAAPGRPPL